MLVNNDFIQARQWVENLGTYFPLKTPLIFLRLRRSVSRPVTSDNLLKDSNLVLKFADIDLKPEKKAQMRMHQYDICVRLYLL